MKIRKQIKFWLITCLFGFMTSCSILPFGNDVGVVSTDVVNPTTVTEQMGGEEDRKSVTSLPTATRTMIPQPTLSPTLSYTWTPFPTKTQRPTWTPSPTLSPTGTKDVGWIIKDDFSKDEGQWKTGSGGNWSMGYTRGGYFLRAEEKFVEITSAQSWLKLDDVRIIVDVYRLNGKGYWGISCRETTGGSYYTIFITDKGEYGYGETRNGRVTLKTLGESPEIFTHKLEVNQIMAECRGNHLNLYVNGTMLFQLEVIGTGSGWAGMMAGTTDVRDLIEVVFDNIEIWGPIDN
jgi:hypothetical protein